jgi:RNA polymerase sigma factor, sigma-70 family
MDQKNEADIIARVLKGDKQAYAMLVEEYKSPIYNLAYRMTGNLEDADDLTQETFIRAYQYLWRYDTRRKFFTWLYTIGINLIRNHLKKRARDIAPPAAFRLFPESQTQGNEGREENLLSEDRIIRLEKTMQKLPVDLREAIILKFHQDLTFEEVAAITGVSLSAVKMRIYRGLDQLKRLMEVID